MEITREIIRENTNNPEMLEDLYQSDKKVFSETIRTMYETEADTVGPVIKFWYTRLFYRPVSKKSNTESNTKKYLYTALLIIIAWIPVRLLSIDFFGNNANLYNYLYKAVPVVISIALSLFFLYGSLNIKNIALSILPNIIVYIYLVLLPQKDDSQSLRNAFFFAFILLWFFILFTYSNFKIKKLNYTSFLEKFGETVIWSTIFIIGGIILVILSYFLFDAIGIDAGDFYYNNIVTLGLVASPFVSLLVIDNFNKVKLSVITANIFLPLITVSLAVFGVMSIFSETKPYEDRNIFILYNVMMVVVIAILVFTGSNGINNKIIHICSYILPVITVILDLVTISAVIYRLGKYGITANKITLLGTNLFMLGHLAYMIFLKFKTRIDQNTRYLPLYFLWAVVVVFIFPFVFKTA